MSQQNDSSVRWGTRVAKSINAALYRALDQRIAIALFVVAALEALVAPFRGTRWAIFSVATTAVAIGLVGSASYIWLQAIGNAAHRISMTYEKETRGAVTPQSQAATLPAGRIN